jgi:hypothetical protein
MQLDQKSHHSDSDQLENLLEATRLRAVDQLFTGSFWHRPLSSMVLSRERILHIL